MLDASERLTVWLIEDSPTDAFVIREALNTCEVAFEITLMADGASALQALRGIEDDATTRVPDLLLLDLNLPKVTGTAVLAEVRKAVRCGGVPVIVVTSSDSPADMEAIRQLGATAYFRKPHDLDQFLLLANVVTEAIRK